MSDQNTISDYRAYFAALGHGKYLSRRLRRERRVGQDPE